MSAPSLPRSLSPPSPLLLPRRWPGGPALRPALRAAASRPRATRSGTQAAASRPRRGTAPGARLRRFPLRTPPSLLVPRRRAHPPPPRAPSSGHAAPPALLHGLRQPDPAAPPPAALAVDAAALAATEPLAPHGGGPRGDRAPAPHGATERPRRGQARSAAQRPHVMECGGVRAVPAGGGVVRARGRAQPACTASRPASMARAADPGGHLPPPSPRRIGRYAARGSISAAARSCACSKEQAMARRRAGAGPRPLPCFLRPPLSLSPRTRPHGRGAAAGLAAAPSGGLDVAAAADLRGGAKQRHRGGAAVLRRWWLHGARGGGGGRALVGGWLRMAPAGA